MVALYGETGNSTLFATVVDMIDKRLGNIKPNRSGHGRNARVCVLGHNVSGVDLVICLGRHSPFSSREPRVPRDQKVLCGPYTILSLFHRRPILTHLGVYIFLHLLCIRI